MERNTGAVGHSGNIVADVIGDDVQCASLVDVVLCVGALPVEAVVAVAHIQPTVVAVLAVVQADSVVALLAVVALAAANVGLTGNAVATLKSLTPSLRATI